MNLLSTVLNVALNIFWTRNEDKILKAIAPGKTKFEDLDAYEKYKYIVNDMTAQGLRIDFKKQKVVPL